MSKSSRADMLARILGLLIVSADTSGCATVFTLSSDRVEGNMCELPDGPRSFPRIYSGVLGDGYCLGGSAMQRAPEALSQVGLLCFLDIPLSLVADTVVLPFRIYEQIRFGNFHPRLVPEVHKERRQNEAR